MISSVVDVILFDTLQKKAITALVVSYLHGTVQVKRWSTNILEVTSSVDAFMIGEEKALVPQFNRHSEVVESNI